MRFDRLRKAEAFMFLAANAFNYEMLGEMGFATVRALVSSADCYRLVYSDLNEVTPMLDALTSSGGC
jgi:hypothetical protein